MNERPTALRDQEFMQAMLDVVIPPSIDGRMPGAGSLGLAAAIAAAIEADALLGPLVQAGLEAVQKAAESRHPGGFAGLDAKARDETVQAQLAKHGVLMIGLARYVYAAYYQHPRVLEGLGEPARPPFPEGYDVEATDPHLLETLLRRQRSR